MAHFGVIDSRGRVTFPPEIRKRLGLRAGDRVEFIMRDKDAVIRSVRRADNPFEKYAGALPAFPGGIAEINAWVRSMRDEE